MSNVIEITKLNAWRAYDEADANGKVLLENLIGKDVLSRNIMDRVKTLEDACNVIGYPFSKAVPYSNPTADLEEATNASMEIMIANRALNEGWIPNWNDPNERKYEPRFKMNSGFGLSLYAVDFWNTDTTVGSHFVYKRRELAEYAATQFENAYRVLFILNVIQ